jgi:hypothetical protein
MRSVAIHQPTFLPWLGWWDKLVRCDVFVLLDAVQFPKKGGSWMNRVQLLVGGRPAWVTVPVERSYHGVRTVREMRIDDSTPWRRKLTQTVATNYSRAPHYADAATFLDAVFSVETGSLAELNEEGARRAADLLKLETGHVVRQSDLGVADTGTALLVELCRAVDGDAYLTGDGAGEYFEAHLFAECGITVTEQRFVPPRYPQQSRQFEPGLSFIDAVANVGWAGTADLVRETARRYDA